jgi:hypothetical protein
MSETQAVGQRCDDCANRGPWRAEYSKVQIGPQAFAVADCPHAHPGTAVTPGSGLHCQHFQPKGKTWDDVEALMLRQRAEVRP